MFLPSRRSAAFTLIELLVVITIIGVLAAILLPALRGVMQRAKQTVSINNLRQIGVATVAYTGDHDYQLPGRITGTGAKWPELLLPYLGLKVTGTATTFPVPKVYRVPIESPATGYDVIDDSSKIDSTQSNKLAIVLNGYNDLGAFNVPPGGTPVEVHVNRLVQPSQVILIGLKLPRKYDYYMDFQEGSSGNNKDILNLAAYRGGSNYLFADGHADFIKQADYQKPYTNASGGSASYCYGDWLWLADKNGGGVIQP